MNEHNTHVEHTDVYSIVTNHIIEILERGTVPWKQTWASSDMPINFVSKRPYTGVNFWMLLSLRYRENVFLTWEQIRKLGWTVRRGERGHMVVFYKSLVVTDEVTKKEKAIPILRYYKVFNIEQCDHVPPPVLAKLLPKESVTLPSCESIVAAMPNRPQIRHQVSSAFYHRVLDYINMPTLASYTDSKAYYSNLFHELIHSTGHSSRLNRKSLTESITFGDEQYSVEELVAELGASYLCFLAGISPATIENSAAYIDGWLKILRGDRKCIIQASSLAQKAVDFIRGTPSSPDQ